MNKTKLVLTAVTTTAIMLFAGCSRSITGVYTLEANPSKRIEFLDNGKLQVYASGDVADYTVAGDTVRVTHLVGGAMGKINGDTITFSGNGIVAGSLRGTWRREK